MRHETRDHEICSPVAAVDDGAVPVLTRGPESGRAEIIRRVDVGAGSNQHFHAFWIVPVTSPHEGRSAVAPCGIDVGPILDQGTYGVSV